MRIAYLAGPMSGYEQNNYPLFERITKWLRDEGHFNKVISPHECVTDQSTSWDQCLRIDIKESVDANCIVLLPDWRASRGACLEAMLHCMLGSSFFDIWLGKQGAPRLNWWAADEVEYQVMTAFYSRVILPSIQGTVNANRG